MQRALPVLAVAAFRFGGFAPDGTHFLKLGAAADQVCAVVTGKEAPACQPITKKAIREAGFVKPERGGAGLHVALTDDRIEVSDGDKVLAAWKPADRVLSVNTNIFVLVLAGPGVVAVEYDIAGGKDVVALAVARAPASAPASAPAPVAGGKNAYDRAMAHGGVWEQRQLPCEQAGVHLKLKKNRKFDLSITTRCQADRNTTELDGLWSSEGADSLTLTFENPDGPTETMPCRFAACADAPGEECLSCQEEDVTFTLQVVRR